MRGIMKAQLQALARDFLLEHWPPDWDDSVDAFEAALGDWYDWAEAGFYDQLVRFKNERDAQAAIAIVEARN
jgi:hypothetical protein